MTNDENHAALSAEIVDQIRPLLAGKPPHVQGLVLADLLAFMLAGYSDPQVREAIIELHVKTARALVQLYELAREGGQGGEGSDKHTSRPRADKVR